MVEDFILNLSFSTYWRFTSQIIIIIIKDKAKELAPKSSSSRRLEDKDKSSKTHH